MASNGTDPGGEDRAGGDTVTVADRLAGIRRRMAKAADRAGRPADGIDLIAVSKVQPDDRIDAALAAGHRAFGENRVQEAKTRWERRRLEVPDLRLHLIGPLQTNKAKEAVALFDTIEVVDRPKLARALAKEMAAQGVVRDCLIQVNTGAEPQKAGVLPAELDALLDLCRDDLALPIKGLMCIPPVEEPPAVHFAFLADLAKARGLPILSMGMSADFEVAIHHGATHVRVGSAAFGERDSAAGQDAEAKSNEAVTRATPVPVVPCRPGPSR